MLQIDLVLWPTSVISVLLFGLFVHLLFRVVQSDEQLIKQHIEEERFA